MDGVFGVMFGGWVFGAVVGMLVSAVLRYFGGTVQEMSDVLKE